MKPVTTWIVIADGARARIVSNTGPGKGIEALSDMVFETDHRPSRDIAADRPGRTFESVGNLRHAKEPRSDPHQNLKDEFIRGLAQTLDDHGARYDRLILVVSPPALGSMRDALTPAVADKVQSELAKDLTHTPNGELASHLDGVIAL